MTKIRQGIIAVLFMFIVTFGLTELLLKVVDPWGADAYFYDIFSMFAAYVPENGYYTLPDGTYEFRHWSATMAEQQRVTPATAAEAACRIVVVGDSMAYGYGVNDDETWVNHLADKNPEVRFENYGVVAASSQNIRARVERLDTDGIIYLFFRNNRKDPITIPERQSGYQSSLGAYLYYVQVATSDASAPPLSPDALSERFLEDMQYLSSVDNLLMLGFDDWLSNYVADEYGLTIIPDFEEAISLADAHPTAAEHVKIAENMQPHVETFIADVCGETV